MLNDEDKIATTAIGCVVVVWIIGALLSLGMTAAIIYFLWQAANGNVF